jgi:hypothetical protein
VIAGLSGCGSDPPEPAADRASQRDRRERPDAPAPPQPPRCPAQASNCVVATGSVLALEAVDPDGDGDAHLILLSPQGITAPGISVIDVARDLRPHPLPGPGDLVAAAGPVFRGSYGQRQIQASELRIARARDR